MNSIRRVKRSKLVGHTLLHKICNACRAQKNVKFARRARHSKLLGRIGRAKLVGRVKHETCKPGKAHRRTKRVGRAMRFRYVRNCGKLLFGFLH